MSPLEIGVLAGAIIFVVVCCLVVVAVAVFAARRRQSAPRPLGRQLPPDPLGQMGDQLRRVDEALNAQEREKRFSDAALKLYRFALDRDAAPKA